MTMWSATYERENSQMDLLNVPFDKVTIEVTEENTALITSLRDPLCPAQGDELVS
jgi:hypothetical protein